MLATDQLYHTKMHEERKEASTRAASILDYPPDVTATTKYI